MDNITVVIVAFEGFAKLFENSYDNKLIEESKNSSVYNSRKLDSIPSVPIHKTFNEGMERLERPSIDRFFERNEENKIKDREESKHNKASTLTEKQLVPIK